MMWLGLIVGFVLLFGAVVFVGAPYVPSHRREVEKAFDALRPIDSSDTVVDLGSGDGVVLRAASRRGAKVLGFELNPVLVMISRLIGRNKIDVKLVDMWTARLPKDVTVVYVFGVSRDMARLKKRLQSESDRLNRQIDLILYGQELPEKKANRSKGGHRLYRFTPQTSTSIMAS